MKHVITALVMNEPGVLAHVAGMFSARGFNIDSLVVGRTEDPTLSRMTIVVVADDRILDQVRKQLEKIVTVVKVRDYKDAPFIARDLMLVKLSSTPRTRSEIIELANLFRGRVVDVGHNTVSVELSGEEDKLDAFVELVRPYGIRELARTGMIAMARGGQSVTTPGADETVGANAAELARASKPAAALTGKRQPTQAELEATPPG
ncbi:MAG TPA: acetolactate synthase small subunit [Phycisphaerae bacterium]|nr:acetolactate synthase small subunit [Phycisphaerae bacterium]